MCALLFYEHFLYHDAFISLYTYFLFLMCIYLYHAAAAAAAAFMFGCLLRYTPPLHIPYDTLNMPNIPFILEYGIHILVLVLVLGLVSSTPMSILCNL